MNRGAIIRATDFLGTGGYEDHARPMVSEYFVHP